MGVGHAAGGTARGVGEKAETEEWESQLKINMGKGVLLSLRS